MLQVIPHKSPRWQQLLAQSVTDPTQLWALLDLPVSLLPGAIQANTLFGLRVPRNFVAKMQKGNPQDPLLLQVMPMRQEFEKIPGYSTDPLAEVTVNPVQGLLQKYKGRVLLTLTGACAVNCRFCFRRHFPYQENNPHKNDWQNILNYIAKDTSIEEVILSGGDPLLASDDYFFELLEKISEISHVHTIRFHSRIPIFLPERITESWLRSITQTRLKLIMILHCNHAQEIDASVEQAVKAMQDKLITVLNQSVLLKNVNDNPKTLIALSRRLWEMRVLPYYLHLLDKVDGAAHFAVPTSVALSLQKEMQAALPGYLVPKFVWESPGAPSKLTLS